MARRTGVRRRRRQTWRRREGGSGRRRRPRRIGRRRGHAHYQERGGCQERRWLSLSESALS
eukprot:scaffold18648_cov124-Isochrysis_galbana.AAC.1